jgi:hypothetical protein
VKSLSPQELRAVTERDYKRSMGLDDEQARRLAVADLELVDAAKRAGDIAERSEKPAAVAPAPRSETIKQAEREQGVRLTDGDSSKFERFGIMHADPTQTDEAWALCCGRLYRICEGSQVAADPRAATRTCTMPDLAYEWLRVMANFKTRAMPGTSKVAIGSGFSGGVDHNPFRGMSTPDALRKFRRMAEDIADKSSSQMGPWRIPK